MNDCLFCKIIKGEIPSKTIYEDDVVKVFLDIDQDSAGHSLIIPKTHYTNIDDIDLETIKHIFKIAKEMHKLFKEKLNIDGMCMAQNNGCIQEVKHYHLHLKPIYKKEKKLNIDEVYKILKDE